MGIEALAINVRRVDDPVAMIEDEVKIAPPKRNRKSGRTRNPTNVQHSV
jgi:hypothetical protein